MIPELKKAIIKFVPDYFRWSEKHQEQYRVDVPEDDIFKIKKFLLKELFDISISTDDEMDQAWQAMTSEQYTKINAALLPLTGIGEDLFYLNEYFQCEKNLLSFDTLYDYDLDDYTFQENSRMESQEDYQKKPYRGYFYSTWARLMIDGSFSYGILSMAARYLSGELDEFGYDYIEKIIPHEFKHGDHHGKAEGAGFLFDMEIDANGLEPQLEELKNRFFEHLMAVTEKLLDEFERRQEGRVYVLDESKKNDPEHHFLFTDKEVLKRIHFKTFIRDCRSVEQTDHSFLTQKLEEEKKMLIEYLDMQYKDILENFDPKIVKFKKKRKVIFHKDSGLDQLLD